MTTEKKVAVITGASSGIGAGILQAFRDRNYRVVATSRSIKPVADEDVVTVQGDVAARDTAERVFRRSESAGNCGGGSADAREIGAAFAFGAAAVQLGTAYLLFPEARISSLYRQGLERMAGTTRLELATSAVTAVSEVID